jgi:hypothetical protein
MKANPIGITGELGIPDFFCLNVFFLISLVDSATGRWDVVVSGVANVSTALTKGKYYFATSQGDLVCADDVSYSFFPSLLLLPLKTTDFVLFPRPGQYITSGNVLVSVQSLVGVAVSDNTILVQL